MAASLHQHLDDQAARLPDQPVSLGELAVMHGPALPSSLLVLVSAPCALPIPGIGNVLGVTMALMALAMWHGRDWTRLPERVARFSLSATVARRVLRLLARVHRVADRCSCQRMSHLAVLPRHTWLAPMVALMGVVIFLPVPFGNVLPALAVSVLGVGLACRDGLAVLASAALALVSVAYTAAVVAGSWSWLVAPLIG